MRKYLLPTDSTPVEYEKNDFTSIYLAEPMNLSALLINTWVTQNKPEMTMQASVATPFFYDWKITIYFSFKYDQYHFNVEDDIFIYRLTKNMMLRLANYNTFIINLLHVNQYIFVLKYENNISPLLWEIFQRLTIHPLGRFIESLLPMQTLRRATWLG